MREQRWQNLRGEKEHWSALQQGRLLISRSARSVSEGRSERMVVFLLFVAMMKIGKKRLPVKLGGWKLRYPSDNNLQGIQWKQVTVKDWTRLLTVTFPASSTLKWTEVVLETAMWEEKPVYRAVAWEQIGPRRYLMLQVALCQRCILCLEFR